MLNHLHSLQSQAVFSLSLVLCKFEEFIREEFYYIMRLREASFEIVHNRFSDHTMALIQASV